MKKNNKKVFRFVVELKTQDEYVTEQEARHYVFDAVDAWCGSLRSPGSYGKDDPGDPMWGARCLTVKRFTRLSGQVLKLLKDVISYKNERIIAYRKLLAQARASLEFIDYKQTLFKEIGVELTKEDQFKGY